MVSEEISRVLAKPWGALLQSPASTVEDAAIEKVWGERNNRREIPAGDVALRFVTSLVIVRKVIC